MNLKLYLSLFSLILLFCSIYSNEPQDTLEEFFIKSLKGKKICYVPSIGNAGDGLIWYGAASFFQRNNIEYTTCWKTKDILSPQFDVVVLGGSGGLIPYYNWTSNFLKNYMNKVKKLVMLPHTIQGHVKLLQNLPEKVVVFCREYMSYNHTQQYVKYPNNVFFSKDMAFHADLTHFNQHYTGPLDTAENLFAFRMDCEVNAERKNIKLPKSNIDISSLGKVKEGYTIEQNIITVYQFLSRIMPYKTIWTDRLHVGIAAFILGKRVHLFENSYGKVGAIYNSTIKAADLHNHVIFHGNNFTELQKMVNE